jgi:hypothetical protein
MDNQNISLDADHRGINKFSSETDENFIKVCDRIDAALQFVPTMKSKTVVPSSTVPFARDAKFVGRSDIIGSLDSIYASSDSHIRAALIGLGGVG